MKKIKDQKAERCPKCGYRMSKLNDSLGYPDSRTMLMPQRCIKCKTVLQGKYKF